MAQFRIKSVSAHNYYSDNNKLEGSITVVHSGTDLKLELKLGPEECTTIFAVIARRVAEMMQETAINVAADLGVDVSNMLETSVNRRQALIDEAKKPKEEVEDAEVIPPAPVDDETQPF